MSTQRANSTSSIASNSSTQSNVEYIKSQRPADVCVPKGKWYDCLRPVPGYQGFGGMSRFDLMNAKQHPELEEGNWTEEVYGKMHEKKGKHTSR